MCNVTVPSHPLKYKSLHTFFIHSNQNGH